MKSILLIFSLTVIATLSGCQTRNEDYYRDKAEQRLKTIEELERADETRFYEVFFLINDKWVPVFSGLYEKVDVLAYVYSENKTGLRLKTTPEQWRFEIPVYPGFTKVKVIRHHRFGNGDVTNILTF